jgi:transcription elongation factor Elf1
MVISCACDSKYVVLLNTLLGSLTANCKTAYTVHARLINCDDKHEDMVRNTYPNIDIYRDYVDTYSKEKILGSDDNHATNETFDNGLGISKIKNFRSARWLLSEFMGYCTNIRFRQAEYTLTKYNDSVLFVDVDALVRGDLSGLENILSNSDFTLRTVEVPPDQIGRWGITGAEDSNQYVGEPGNVEYHLGVLGISNTDNARKVLKCAADRVENNMGDFGACVYEWINALHLIPEAVAQQLPPEYKDEGKSTQLINSHKHSTLTFDEHSIIWSGAGRRKTQNDQYVNEYKKYE